ncbi:MAG: HAD-IA family hydrolase [Xanthobacteraceae bacterium]|nr:HAD-IA family hydrolase [Xanthobacteraceae bacterium]
MPLDLIIFDCDGVLVDSEVISCRVHAEQLTRAGYPITAEEVFSRFLGRSAQAAHQEVEAELGRRLPDDFDARLKAALFQEFAASLRAVPHVAETLAAITVPVCVASSGAPDKIAASLTRTGLLPRFAPHVFSAAQVARGKPAPDLFLFAADRMGAEPGRCLVIEDSVPGVTAARAAGMTAIGFCGGGHCGHGHAATLIAAGARAGFDDMRQLTEIIRKFAASGG